MSTTPSGATRVASTGRVIAIRPRVLALRAGAVRARLDHPSLNVSAHRRRSLDIIGEVLDRADQVTAADHDAWERLLWLLEQHRAEWALPACAAAANLLALGIFGETEDHLALHDLAGELGHDRLARMQHRYGCELEPNAGLPVTTAALRQLTTPHLRRHLTADLGDAELAGAIDDACLRAAHALLGQGVDRSWTVPTLESADELVDIALCGNVVEWRHHLAMVIEDAWSPYTERVVELARSSGHAHTAAVIAAFVDLWRDKPPVYGGEPLPSEIGWLMARGGDAVAADLAQWARSASPRAERDRGGVDVRRRAAKARARLLRTRAALLADRRAQVSAAVAPARRLRSVPDRTADRTADRKADRRARRAWG